MDLSIKQSNPFLEMQIPNSCDESKTEVHGSQVLICRICRHYPSLYNYSPCVHFPFNLLMLKKKVYDVEWLA